MVMEVIHLDTKINEDIAIALGFFDGIHLGHQEVLKTTLNLAHINKIKSAILTFDINPKCFVLKQEQRHLMTLQQKYEFLKKLGFNYMIVIPFDEVTATMSKQAFIDEILIKNHVKHVVCGNDFKFGKSGLGNVDTLKSYRCFFKLTMVYPLEIDCYRISSSMIKQELIDGNIEQVNALLGHTFTIRGEVVKGKQRGKSVVGFATANTTYNGYVLPHNGVYAVQVVVANKSYYGMANIGYNPTFGDINKSTLEVHIFDFNTMIYGETIEVAFCSMVRFEKKFDDIVSLTKQLELDQIKIKELFKKEA